MAVQEQKKDKGRRLLMSLVIIPAFVAGTIMLLFFLADMGIFFIETDDEYLELLQTSKDPNKRALAANVLGVRKSEPAIDSLKKALKDDVAAVRMHAAMALAHIAKAGSADARTALPDIIHLLDDPDPRTPVSVCESLAMINDPQSIPPLLERLGHENSKIRQASARALGKMGHPSALEPLKKLLKDPQPEVRFNTALAIARYRDKACLPVLLTMLETTDEAAWDNALYAIGSIGDASTLPNLEAFAKRAAGTGSAEKALTIINAMKSNP